MKSALFFGLFILSAMLIMIQPSPAVGSERPSNRNLQQVINWLPHDIETLCVMTGPFIVLPQEPEASDHKSSWSFAKTCEKSIFAPLGYSLPTKLYSLFVGKTVLLAVEGSKDFASPNKVGANSDDGVHICVFKEPMQTRLTKYLKAGSSVSGCQVWSMEANEADNKQNETLFLALPTPNCVAMSTSRQMLYELLKRVGKSSTRAAMPDSLPEWSYLRSTNRFWAIRHYARSSRDVASPFYSPCGAFTDDQAIGVVFQYDTRNPRICEVTYLSRNPSAAELLKQHLLPRVFPTGTTTVVRLNKTAVSIRVEVITANQCLYGLEALLGHSVFF